MLCQLVKWLVWWMVIVIGGGVPVQLRPWRFTRGRGWEPGSQKAAASRLACPQCRPSAAPGNGRRQKNRHTPPEIPCSATADRSHMTDGTPSTSGIASGTGRIGRGCALHAEGATGVRRTQRVYNRPQKFLLIFCRLVT